MVFTRLTLFFPWNKESRFERGANEEGRNRTTLHKVGEPRQVISLCLDLTFSRVGISQRAHACTCVEDLHAFWALCILRNGSCRESLAEGNQCRQWSQFSFPKMHEGICPSSAVPHPTASACREMTAEAIKCIRWTFSACRMCSTDGFPRVSCKMGQDTSGTPREQLESKQLWFWPELLLAELQFSKDRKV